MTKHSTPVQYLSRSELAARIGVKPDTLNRYQLPEPDALIGDRKGWLPATVDTWHAARPRVATSGHPCSQCDFVAVTTGALSAHRALHRVVEQVSR